MKINKEQLKQLIKEELDSMGSEERENPKRYIIKVLKECVLLLKTSVRTLEEAGREDLADRATSAAIHAYEAQYILEGLR